MSGDTWSPRVNGSTCPMPVERVQVTVHHINNLPKGMQQLDPTRTSFEVVVQGTAKYYLASTRSDDPHGVHRLLAPLSSSSSPPVGSGSSLARIEMATLAVPFSPSSILFRKERFVVEFDQHSNPSASPSPSHRESGFLDGFGAPNGGAQKTPSPSKGPRVEEHRSSETTWTLPAPPMLTPVFEVFVGMKEKRVGSEASHWLSSGQTQVQGSPMGTNGAGDQQGTRFLVSYDAILSNKVVVKTVGLSTGQVAVSFSVRRDDTDGAVYRIQRLAGYYSQAFPNLAQLNIPAIVEQRGETGAFSDIKRVVDPDYYRKRAESILSMYSPDQVPKVKELLEQWLGNEEELLRHLVLTHGPELCSVNPRHRLAAFVKKHKITDGDVAACFPAGQYSTHLLDSRTEYVFEVLCAKFGNEPRPSSYLFPPVAYDPDRRTYLLESLAFPSNRPGGKNWRDIAQAARQKRTLFASTPGERDISKTTRSGRQLTEIETLQEKHDQEFKQLIPCVADSLQAVIAQHSTLAKLTPKDDRFAIYETNSVPGIQLDDYVHRIAEYTYISPASMLAALIFLDRLCDKYPSLLLTDKNVFKLFFAAVRVASKVVDLRSLNNKNFSSVGGVGNKHLNDIEETFLKQLRFDLFLAPQEFAEYARRVQPPAAHMVPRQLIGSQQFASGLSSRRHSAAMEEHAS